MKKIALIWPWFSTLADNYAIMLNELGYETIVLTTNKNWNHEKLTTNGIAYNKPTLKNLFSDGFEIYNLLKKFKPDLIICEEYADPRFLSSIFIRGAEVWIARHDPEPHDENHVLSIRQKILINLNNIQAREILTFSKSSLEQTNANKLWRLIPEIPINQLETQMPKIAFRKNFVTFGRIETYKNVEWLVNFWNNNEKVLKEEKLYIYGKGKVTFSGKNVIHVNERYNRVSLMKQLRNFRASIFPYKTASQSGVLLISQAVGLGSIVSPIKGLVEFQSSTKNIMTAIDDEQSLLKLISKFLDEKYANMQGINAHLHLVKAIENAKKDIAASLN